jgi:hypothetical protein
MAWPATATLVQPNGWLSNTCTALMTVANCEPNCARASSPATSARATVRFAGTAPAAPVAGTLYNPAAVGMNNSDPNTMFNRGTQLKIQDVDRSCPK